MRQNPERRTALLDAAIEVLAREGSRGLTLRAVDAGAGVPVGTTSNYFRNRAELLRQVMQRTGERLTPAEATVSDALRTPPSPELSTTLLQGVVARMRADRSSHLAMLELRLEATRRPELRADLTRYFGDILSANIAFHEDLGLPGDRNTIVLLYLATLGLIVDDLTVPDLLEHSDGDGLMETLASRLLFLDNTPSASDS